MIKMKMTCSEALIEAEERIKNINENAKAFGNTPHTKYTISFLETAKECIEKQIAKPPKYIDIDPKRRLKKSFQKHVKFMCPSCGTTLFGINHIEELYDDGKIKALRRFTQGEKSHHCVCGQKIDWGEI